MRAVLGAQFFTSLADNALLIVAIGLLVERAAPAWMTPALRICLYLAYVVLAPFAGALADAFPKGRVMLLSNVVKLGACLLLAADAHPLLAFGAIGVIGVTYGPAKYGILAELVPADQLVKANAWIEMSTVASILGGTALGGLLLAPPYAVASRRAQRQPGDRRHLRGVGAVRGGDPGERAGAGAVRPCGILARPRRCCGATPTARYRWP